MFCQFWEKHSSSWFFFQDLRLNFHSFLGFQHGSDSSVKWIMQLSLTLPLAISLKCFWFLIALLFYPKSILRLSFLVPKDLCQIFLPTKLVFKKILTKAFCQHILNLMSKKKLGSFNDLIVNTCFYSILVNPLYVCHNIDMTIFWPASFKFPWHYLTEFSQSWKDSTKTLQSHGNLQSLADLINGANSNGIHSNSRE